MKNKNKKQAFSLAEALLAMAVVGIIGSLCIPSLKSYADEQQLVSLARKAYSTATKATEQLEVKYGEARWWNWETSNINAMYRSIMSGTPQSESWNTPLMNGESWGVGPSWWRTADNMVWYVYNYHNAQGSLGVIHVDTNGKTGPNRVGCDVLGFVVNDTGVFPLNDGKNDVNGTWGCVSYAIQHGKMPWLKDPNMTTCPSTNE